MSTTNNGTEEPLGRVLLQAADPDRRRQTSEFLEHLGYVVADDDAPNHGTDIIVVSTSSSPGPVIPPEALAGDYAPPLIVFGPVGGKEWRRWAIESGAFACLSWEAPFEERVGLLSAASRYREAQKEIQVIREESNSLITRLLQTYGEEAEKVHIAVDERRKTQDALDRIRKRIIRSIL